MLRRLRRRDWFGIFAAATASGLLVRARAQEVAELLRAVGTPQDFETPLRWFDRLITPTSVFFVRSHFGPPALDLARRLRIEGSVKKPLDLSLAELDARPQATVTAVLQCAGNGRALQAPRVPGVQWRHGAMGQATWTGVRLKDLLHEAGVAADAAHVRLAGADLPPKPMVPKFVRSIPLARAIDEGTLVATRMNGEPLTLAHGAPFRLVVPGWAGDHWVKWLASVRVQKEEAEGFFMQTAYKLPKTPVAPGAAVGPEQMQSLTTFPIKSVIARPSEGESMKAGAREIVGIAFSGEAAIDKVEVRIDDGPFVAAQLEGEAKAGTWRVFRHRFDAKPGKHTVVVRATDAKGVVQPETAAWNPSGYFWNAWHRVEWEVVA